LLNQEYIVRLQKKRVIALAMEYIRDDDTGMFPIVHVMSEIAGISAILMAAEQAATDVSTAVNTALDRVKTVLALGESWPGHKELLNTLAYDGKTTAEQAAVQILNAEAATRRSAASVLQTPVAPTAAVPAPVAGAPLASAVGGTVVGGSETTDVAAKREWDSNPALASEFDSFESFLALKKYDAKNTISTGKGA
jgi:hypothetical protein